MAGTVSLHATPDIGPARCRAAPPVLGWTAITGHVAPDALLLFLIIFLWTPPHFWSLALYREKEYAKVGIPMLPVTHGREFTQLQILLYTVLLVAVTIMPFATHMSGWLYFLGAAILNAGFLYYAVRLYRNYSDELARKTFRYSINYLALLFALLLFDHYRVYIHEALQSACIVILPALRERGRVGISRPGDDSCPRIRNRFFFRVGACLAAHAGRAD
jgi:protoheme IX farnesyltransferase